MPSATLTSKGQLTVPKRIREFLRVKEGDRLDFAIEDGRVIVRPGTADLRSLRGILKTRPARPVSVEDMNAAILREHSRRP